eukprot:TRINITY_DN26083_c0_g2_i1.p1 TRINITY_DN26083_c0_g2~~TRINITY_DN26083_c0_g2_i1.p1  ORF type:complete len:458 (-),score=74.71 TRINITY_DN26083_c0_g2_i1:165-1538(-)
MMTDLANVRRNFTGSWSMNRSKRIAAITSKEDPRSPRVLRSTHSVREAVELLNSPGFEWPYAECYVKSSSKDEWYCLTADDQTPDSPIQPVKADKPGGIRIPRPEGPAAAVSGSLLRQSTKTLNSLPSVENKAFLFWIMGGSDRIDMIKRNLAQLKRSGAHCMVLTNGFDDDVHKALSGVGLDTFFEAICGTQPLSVGGGHITFLSGPVQERVPLPGWVQNKRVTERYDKPFVMNQMLAGRNTPSWVQDTFGCSVERIVYVDDNAEKCRDHRLASVALEKEGPGMMQSDFDQVQALVDQSSGLAGAVCVVFDFDCTLSTIHMYKAMNNPQSSWRRRWNKWLEQEFGAPPAPSDWLPDGRKQGLVERNDRSRSPSQEMRMTPSKHRDGGHRDGVHRHGHHGHTSTSSPGARPHEHTRSRHHHHGHHPGHHGHHRAQAGSPRLSMSPARDRRMRTHRHI